MQVRQIPYTCAKLAGYEIISEQAKKAVIAFETHRLDCQAKKEAELSANSKKGANNGVTNGGSTSSRNRNKKGKAVEYSLNGLQRAVVQLGSGITAGRNLTQFMQLLFLIQD